MIQPIHPREFEVVRFVDDYHRKNGFCPTVREVADALGCVSSNAAFKYILRCIDLEFLAKKPGIARTLALTPKGRAFLILNG